MRTSSQVGRLFSILILAMLFISGRGMAQQKKSGQNETLKADSVKYYVAKGNAFRQLRKFEDALQAFVKARTFQPANKEAIVGIMGANFELNRMDEGLKVLDEWIKLEPNNTDAWFYVSIANGETNHPEAALTAFNRLVELAPDSIRNRVGQIQMLVALKRWDETVKACDKAIQRHPDPDSEMMIWSMKAYSLAGLGKYDEALNLMNKTIELYPNSKDAIYNRACIYSIMGNKANALADLKKAIEMNPDAKQSAIQDKDFTNLYNDEDFKKLTAGGATNGEQVKFEVPKITDERKYQRVLSQAENNNLLMISYAKSLGKTPEDAGGYVAEQVKTSWNKEMGFDGFVNTILYIWASLNPDGAVTIVEQDEGKIVFKAPSTFNNLKMMGSDLNVSYDEYLRFLRVRYGILAEYLKASITLNDSADGLTVTIMKIQK